MSILDPIRERHRKDLIILDQLEDYLRESVEICSHINLQESSREDLREIGALTDRFQRAQDFFVSHTLRSIDLLSGDQGTTLDVLQRSEQRGIIDSAENFLEMRALRNKIAHEYAGYGPSDIVQDILHFAPQLLASFSRAHEYKVP
jgi:uncharacterized protein YutE (UPF0331/DUF86 family)